MSTYHANEDGEELAGGADQRVGQGAKGLDGEEDEELTKSPTQTEEQNILGGVRVAHQEGHQFKTSAAVWHVKFNSTNVNGAMVDVKQTPVLRVGARSLAPNI